MKVSVIMPSYNCARFMAASVESVLAQTYSDWELLIADDCSTDGGYELALSYAQKDTRIRVFRTARNSGAACCRNLALSHASGEYIAFLDSDDLWLPEKLGRQLAFMQENDCDFSYTCYERISADGASLGQVVSGSSVVTRRMLFRSNYLGCLTVMYNAAKLGKFYIRDDIYKRNDHAIWLKIIQKTDCRLLALPLAQYQVRNGGLSRVPVFKMLRHHFLLYRLSEQKSVAASLFLVAENLIFGFLRKKKYTVMTNTIHEMSRGGGNSPT